MTTEQREREDKYVVDTAFVMPPLADLAPAQGEVVQSTVVLRSTYFDTADHALLGHGVTLRRREGNDEGWHLKVPDGNARTEIRLPLTDDTAIPAELAQLVTGISLGADLAVVAVVQTTRRIQRLIGPDGATVLEAADDTVTATAPGAAVPMTTWREIELELGSGSEALLAKAGRRLVKAGARRSDGTSKLGIALAATPPADVGTAAPGSHLTDYLAEQFRALAAGDVALRRGLEAIHPTRVATRRLRSTLRVFGPLLDQAAAQDLDGQLAWYAALLGEVRDREVQRERFSGALAQLPPELVLGPVAATIEERLLSEQLEARRVLMEELSGDRYLTMLMTVAAWATAPPLGDEGGVEAKALRRLSAAAAATARKKLARALAGGAGDEALHTARKAAKRARYAAEAAAPVMGRHKAQARINACKAVQEVLGEHQDSLVAADLLRRMGAEAGTTPGQNGFTYGLLHAREQRIAEQSREAAAELAL